MQVTTRQENDALVVEVAGDWELRSPLPHFEDQVAGRNGEVRSVRFDVEQLGTWDSSLLTFLLEGVRYCETHDLEFQEESLPDDVASLLALSQAAPRQEVPQEEGPPSWVARFGKSGIAAYEEFLSSAAFTGEVTTSFGRLLTLRARLRWRDFWLTIQSTSAGALPIVTLISFLVGLIIAFLGAVVLQQFAADYYVSYLVGYGILRELGALMTAVIMAGRTGAAFAAELGTMKITEELDAFRTLGVAPIDYLVLPRILAVVLTLPLLTIYANFIGIFGGLLVSVNMLDISTPQFINGLLAPLTLTDALLGPFKAVVFGTIIGFSGCMRGMQTGTDAGAVGKAATSAVVTAITLIILANAAIDWLAALLNI